jgi:hypothetical protein
MPLESKGYAAGEDTRQRDQRFLAGAFVGVGLAIEAGAPGGPLLSQ